MMQAKLGEKYECVKKCCQYNFPRYEEIVNYLKLLATLHRDNVRLETIGRSIEGRNILMIVIQNSKDNPKDAIMIESGIHAREWLTYTTALYIADEILKTKKILKYMDFYIIPCLNPDGYEYSHTNCRFWRKNMNKNDNQSSKNWGVDLNRNFSYSFGTEGSSSKISNALYRGNTILSEPESQSLAKTITKYAHLIKLYVALHCFGQLIMYPWGYTEESVIDVKDLHNCAVHAQKCIKNKYPACKFSVGQLSKIKYLTSGNSVDYVRGMHNIKFAFAMELHKGGSSGCVVKPSKIVAVAKETVTGIKAMVKFVSNFYAGKTTKLVHRATKKKKSLKKTKSAK